MLYGGAVVVVPVPGFDQRGDPFSRTVDGDGDGVVRIDIGAYESQGVPGFSPGDFNRDGSVDSGDYSVWHNELGSNVTPFDCADADGDGIISVNDYAIWKSHFGQDLTFALGSESSGPALAAESSTAVARAFTALPLSPPISEPVWKPVTYQNARYRVTNRDTDVLAARRSIRPGRPTTAGISTAPHVAAPDALNPEPNSLVAAIDAVFADWSIAI